ncbi:MAG: flagellar biosynthesis anti-sigma factor FlgM [Halanaerobiales bacterium]
MKIDNVKVSKIAELYNKQKENKTEKNKRNDKLDISKKAISFKDMKKELDNISEVREKRVDELKTTINKGNYEVDSKKIAEKMLNNLG